MSHTKVSQTNTRRRFLKCALVSTILIPVFSGRDASAAELTPLDPSDATAQSLGFVTSASKAASTNPTIKSGQHCGVCLQFQGKSSDAAAGCSLYPGHSVPSGGWCGAFAQRS
jgi:High potential iron-sulfur protein